VSTHKKAYDEGRTVVWVDESGFYLLPRVVRTYAPRGHTPVLHVPLTRDHLSVISAITPAGQLLVHSQDHAYKGPAIVRFVRHLWRHSTGKLLVIWDGSPLHRAQPVKDFLAHGAAARLHRERLPGYAPALNPDEGIWHYLTHVELRILCCHDLPELRHALRAATTRLRHKRHVIAGCVTHAGYDPPC